MSYQGTNYSVKGCKCCPICWQNPCDDCAAGGFCEEIECECDRDNDDNGEHE